MIVFNNNDIFEVHMKYLYRFILTTSFFMFSLVYGITPPQVGQFPTGFWEQMERQDIGQAYGDSGWVKKMTDWRNNPVRDAQLEFNIPVLLGKYSGATTYFTAQDFQNSLFDDNATGSMSEYYTEISYGNFTVDGTAGGWYQSSYTMSEANSNTKLYVAEIAQLADPDFDYSQFDNDGPDNVPNSGDDDGYVDGIAVVYSGCGAEWGEGNDNLWPHMSSLGTSYQYTTNDASANGGYIIVNSYFVAPELAGGGDCYTDIIRPMGVYAHEFGHILGLPDLYDRDADNGSSEGIGNWCLMAGGSWNGWAGDTPAHMSAWCKQEMGWVDPTVLDTDQGGVDIPQTETNAFALKIWEDDYFWSRYFLVENRQQTGFDAGLPSNGLMIYHVDENRRWGSNRWSSGPVNDDHTHKLVDVEAADGNEDMDNGVNRGDGGDPFPGSASNTDFSSNSNPNSNRYSGATTDIVVTSISSSSSTMTADINLETRKGIPVVYDSTGVSGWGWGYSDPADSWGGVLFEYPSTELENGYLTEVDIGFRTSDNSYTLYVYDSFDGSTPGNLMFETSGSFSTSGWVSLPVDSILVEPGQEFFVAYMLEDKSYAISFDKVTAPAYRSFFSGNGVTYSSTLGESYNINLRAKISNQNGTQDINEPDIAVSPDSLSEELYVGDSATQVLTISNNGDADLEWEIVAGAGSSNDNNSYSGCVDEYSDSDCGWALVAFEDAGYTQNLLYLGVDSGLVDLDNSGNIGHQLGDYSGEVLIVAGDYYYKFSSDSNIFVNLHSPFIDLYDFVSNDDQLNDWVEQDGGIQFCRGAQYPNIRPGDTSWGLIPNGSTQRGCGCNSGGWSGYGAYYGGFESGCTSCGCQGGGWSGTRANGEHKGAGAYLNVDLEIYIRNVSWLTTSVNSGILSPGDNIDLDVIFNADGLNVGDYQANIVITSNDPDEPSIEIPVHLDVDMLLPDIAVSPDSLSEELYVGDSSTQVLTISNNGDADLDWEISFSAQQRVLDDFILPPGFIGNLDLSNHSATSTGNVILRDRPLSTHNNSTLDRDTMYDVLVYHSSTAVSSVINEHPEINATQASSYVPEDLQDYQVLFNIRQDDIYSEETLEWIYNGGTWVGEWHSNDYPISSWGVIEGTSAGYGTSGSISVNILDPDHWIAQNIAWENYPASGGANEFMRNITVSDPDANVVISVNHSSYGEVPLIVEKHYGSGTILLFNWDYQDNPTTCEELIQQVAYYACRGSSVPWLSFADSSGTVAAGSSQEIEIGFSAVELDTGVYDTEFFVLSNDPDEPSMSVSAHLEVEMPFPNITVTPDSLNEHLFSGDSSIQSIVISNDGIADLNWNLNILDYGRDGTAYTFTNCGNEGFIGPSQENCDDEYLGTLLEGIVTVTEGIQEWVVPQTGLYRIEVWGAQGGSTGSYTGGLGTRMRGEFVLDEGDIVHLIIGQEGTDGYNNNGAGGGGATAVMIDNDLFVVSGGGGGAGTGEAGENGNDGNPATSGLEGNIANGNISSNGTPGINGNGGTGGTWYAGSGGAGWLTNGSDATGGGSGSQGGTSLSTSGTGGQGSDYSSGTGGDGGFGGGAGAKLGGGGGGGYSGGAGAAHGGSWNADGGGGGGSYNAGENQDNEAGVHSGDGIVVITLDSPSISWVSASENSGTVPVGESHTVNMSFNSSELEEGDYLADINIYSNDPDEPVVDIPVMLSVFTDILMTELADTSVYEDSGLELALSANYPGYDYAFTASSDTSGVEASVYNDTLILSPGVDWTGTASIELVLTLENSLSETTGFNLTVHAVNDPPNAYDEVYYMDEDDTLVTVLPADDGDSLSGAEDDQGLTFIAITGLQYGSYDLGRTDGQLTYAPNPDYFGPDSLQYVLTDDGTTAGQSDPLSDTALIVIHTLPINDSPVLESLSDTTMYEDSTMAIIVTATDIDNDDLYLESLSSIDEYITVEIVDTVLYINSYFNWFGSATITVIASDNMGRAIDVEEFQLTVLPVNDAPYFDNLFALEGVGIEFELHLFAYDIDGDTLSMMLDTDWTYPDWLALDYDPFRLTGTAPEPGEFHFPLHLSDGQATVTDTFHLSVHYFHPRITAITDVPDDQGGRVYIDFNRSFFDNPDATNQFYTVFRLDEIGDSTVWVGVGTGSANGNETYSFEVSTLVDSTGEQDGMTEFKVVAFMNEGAFQSESAMGYSLDNLAPDAPGGLTANVVDEGIYLLWDICIAEDFQQFNLEKSLTYEFAEYETLIITDTSYMDPDYVLNETQYYRLTAVDISGNVSDYSDIVEAAVLALDEDLIPDVYALHQNYPNPFNPVTNIRYDLPEDAHVMIRIFDIQGRMVKTLVSGQEKAGRKSIIWDATNQIGEQVAAGMYLYLIQAGEFQKTRKMVLLK